MIKITKTQLINHFTQTIHTFSKSLAEQHLTSAAVLIPIIDNDNLDVIFTVRTSHLRDHAGQISFPGGRQEESDPNLTATALRETFEEIGLRSEQLNLLGNLEPVVSIAGYWVNPLVSLVIPPIQLQLEPNEVAAVFVAPLNFVLDPRNQQRQELTHQGKTHEIHVIQYGEYRIWGMTARILVNLSQNLDLR